MKRVALLAAFILSTLNISAQKSPQNESYKQLEKFNQFYALINQTYIDELDMNPLVEEAIREVLLELDPHSSYITPEEMQGVEESFNGEFSGVGIEFNILNDTLVVVNTIVGAPAESVGLMPGDRIIGIDGENAVGLKMVDVPKKLKGLKGTKVELDVHRTGLAEPLTFLVVRDNIPLHTIDAAYKIDDKTGYIRVNRFGSTTMNEFREAFDNFGEVEALVLDLRGNGGGLLSQAIEMANFFLPRGATVVYTEGRNYPKRAVKTDREGRFQHGKLIVVVDENSASASEIVAGAIQDWDRGVIIGQPSFGKGLIQRQYPFSDGSAARITIAQYLTPSGRAIQRPYDKGDKESYFKHHMERTETEEGEFLESFESNTRPIFYTLKEGRKVYGGGGITPDYAIKHDDSYSSDYYFSLIRQGVINEFLITYLDAERTNLESKYDDFTKFNTSYVITPAMLDSLEKFAQSHGVESTKDSTDSWRDVAKVNLKALLAQRLFSTSEFYEVVNESDTAYTKALQALLK